MFDLFKTDKKPEVSTKEVVEQIHHEFNTAADLLLEEAKKIIASTDKKSADKAQRLLSLGFGNAREVSQGMEVIQKISISEKNVKLIEEYQKQYPDYKFLPKESAEAICKKYNLLIARTSRYKGFVPEKNLVDIENFYKKVAVDKDLILTYQGVDYILHDAVIHDEGRYTHVHKTGKIGPFDPTAFQSDYGSMNFYGGDHQNIFGLKHLGFIINAKLSKGELFIAAPAKDIELNNSSIKDFKVTDKVEYPDPVVLYQVSGGYLIVTAWGDEAEDPIIKG